MQKWIIGKCMNAIRETKSFDHTKLEEIEYGLISIYMLITKTIIIFTLAYFLGVLKELVIFMLIYNLIRMPSFGLHATKSSLCLIASSILFLMGLFLSLTLQINIYIKVIIGIYCIIRFYQNAPADTYKKPIINRKRREVYKVISTLLAICFTFGSLFIPNQFISNSFIFTLCIQSAMISPFVYKIWGLPYDNYKTYLSNNGLNEI